MRPGMRNNATWHITIVNTTPTRLCDGDNMTSILHRSCSVSGCKLSVLYPEAAGYNNVICFYVALTMKDIIHGAVNNSWLGFIGVIIHVVEVVAGGGRDSRTQTPQRTTDCPSVCDLSERLRTDVSPINTRFPGRHRVHDCLDPATTLIQAGLDCL